VGGGRGRATGDGSTDTGKSFLYEAEPDAEVEPLRRYWEAINPREVLQGLRKD
jgi:hypothetical protein